MQAQALAALREAGRVAAAVREIGARQIVAGARLREVCEAVEEDIERRGAHPAFPVQSSRNQVAAHYCAAPDDETVYIEGDLAKLDIGVHVDGYVVDTAVTVNVGDGPEGRAMVEAARSALDAAIAAAAPGVEIRRLSAVIEQTVLSFGLRPMRRLCGHGVGRWIVHCPPAVPNVPEDSPDRLEVDAVVAIEPFVTDGYGLVAEMGIAEVFRLDPQKSEDALAAVAAVSDGRGLLEALRGVQGLPFARRQLARFPRPLVEEVLRALTARGALVAYRPLVETGGRPVAQAEHTIHIGTEGVEVLTR